MKVKLKTNYAKPPELSAYVGDVIDLPEEEAQQLISLGYAVAVKEERTAHHD